MTHEQPAEQHARLNRWLQRCEVALLEAQYAGVSEHTRCSAAFDAGYFCALYLVGPDAMNIVSEHPSEKVLRKAAEISNVDVGPGLLHLERQLWDPVGMPDFGALLAWARSMRTRVLAER